MGIDKYNPEGYYDPTCYEALTNVAKVDRQPAFRPLVYICSPFSGDTKHNIEQARKYSRFAYEKKTIPSHHICFIHSLWKIRIRQSVKMLCTLIMYCLGNAMNCGCLVM